MTFQQQQSPAAVVAERRNDLFVMIAELSALASRRGEKSLAIMLNAIVSAYR